MQCSNALMALMILAYARRIEHATAYVTLHVVLGVADFVLAKYDDAPPRRLAPLTFCHYWLPAIFVVLVYFELGILIPQIRSFSDFRYDHTLQAIDVWLVGDPVAVVERFARAPLSDVLTLCYLSYYGFALLLPAVVYARVSAEAYERVGTTLLIAFLLSYVGYVFVPAIGPHRLFDAYRPVALDGYGIGRWGYHLLHAVPNEPPDAFPSGHTLIGTLVPVLAWRWYRPLFPYLAVVALGIVIATVYLRYHYLTDLAVAFALVPVALKLGNMLERRFGSAGAERESQGQLESDCA
jgi:membrane-associated phospholipid phosphatase